MGKVVRCPACSSYYNGAVYSNCPYCSGASKADDGEEQKQEHRKGLRSLFRGKSGIKAEEPQKRSTSHDLPVSVQENAKVEHIPPSQHPDISQSLSDVPDEELASKSSRMVPPTTGMEDALSPIDTLLDEHVNTPARAQTQTQAQAQAQDPASAPALTLSQALNLSGRKTVGKYVGSSGESIMPVVGWLVCVKGAYYGQSFNLKSGRNRIGRSHDMDIKLLNDDSVSRSSVAVIIFEPKSRGFSIISGESDSLCYIDGKPLYDNDRCELHGYEEVEFGDQELNKFVFVPFCGERFHWPKNTSENESIARENDDM